MKILLLSQFFSSTRGGGEYLFYIIVKKLIERNHQVWLITNKIENETYFQNKNLSIIFVPPVLKYQGGLPSSIKENIQFLINATKEGMKIIKENDIEIIHSNNFTPAFTGGLLSLFTSKAHITSVWDVFSLCGCDYWKKWVRQTDVSKINQFIGPVFEKLILRTTCKMFHTISDASKEDLRKFGAKKPICVIAPTIEEVKYESSLQNNKQFICIGRLVFYKNIEVLIKAISIVKDQEPGIRLVIVGGGPHLNILQKMIKEMNLEDNVIIRGYVDTEEKFRLLSESNAMLFPSLCEGFGLVILEAFSQNKPVLVSNIRPMSDIINHQETGFVLEPDNENQWAEHILRLVRNPQESQQMGNNANKVFKETYNQDTFYEKTISMYKSALAKKQ